MFGKNEKEVPQIPTFKEKTKFYEFLKKSKPTQLMVINFTASWCMPCTNAKEPFETLAQDYKDQVRFANVDVDHLMKIAEKLEVKMMPTFLLVKVRKIDRDQQRSHKEKQKKKHDQDKKESAQGDKGKQENPVLHKKYEMLRLGTVVGYKKPPGTEGRSDTMQELGEKIDAKMHSRD